MPCTTPGTPRPIGGAARRLDADQLGARCRRSRRRCRSRSSRRRRRRRRRRDVAAEQRLGTARGPRRRSPGGTRAPSTGTGAGPSPSRGSSACVSTVATQSRIASLTASFSVRLPELHGVDLGAEQPHAEHVERLALDVDRAHVDLALHARAAPPPWRVATPCWPAPVSATSRRLAHALGQQRLAEHVVDLVRAGVVEVLALRAARARRARSPRLVALGEGRRAAGVVAQERVELGAERRDRPTPSRNAASSSWHAGTSVSGTKRPPNSPKRPSAVGFAPCRRRSPVGPHSSSCPVVRAATSGPRYG